MRVRRNKPGMYKAIDESKIQTEIMETWTCKEIFYFKIILI